jgi:hypothetical protein
MLKITKRPLTVDDFLKIKKCAPYSDERTRSKAPNFSSIFGSKPWMLLVLLVKGGYTEKDFDTVINSIHLEDSFEKAKEDYGQQKSEFDIKGYTVSKFIREKFFKMYPGLDERIKREIKFGMKHGYIQHYHGIKRMLPELTLMHFDPEKGGQTLLGADRSFYMAELNNLLNVCANTNIQGSEPPHALMLVSWCLYTIKAWNKFIRTNGNINQEEDIFANDKKYFLTRIFNNIHDSADFYCPKSEQQLMVPLIRYCMEYKVTPGFSVSLPIEIEKADVTAGEIYKHGTTLKLDKDYLPLDQAIEKYCKEHNLPKLPMPVVPKGEDGKDFVGFAPALSWPTGSEAAHKEPKKVRIVVD